MSKPCSQNYLKLIRKISHRVGGIVVSIAAFQAVDPGSIPGQRKCFFDLKLSSESLIAKQIHYAKHPSISVFY